MDKGELCLQGQVRREMGNLTLSLVYSLLSKSRAHAVAMPWPVLAPAQTWRTPAWDHTVTAILGVPHTQHFPIYAQYRSRVAVSQGASNLAMCCASYKNVRSFYLFQKTNLGFPIPSNNFISGPLYSSLIKGLGRQAI